jgi:uncharacterized OsmC-like protein
VRGVRLPSDHIRSYAEGINEMRDRMPVLTGIQVSYTIQIPEGTRETVDKALARHVDKCPTAQSLKDSVEFSWTAEILEE